MTAEVEGGAIVKVIFPRVIRLLRSEDGPTTTEYAVLLAVIAMTVIGTMSMFGTHVANIWAIVDHTLDVF